jgi:polyhydroxyalkanoate synthesis regulator phasin
MSPFEPVGELARWRVLYEMLRPIQPDGVLSYEEMADALTLDPVADKTTIQLAMRRAARELEVRDNRAVDSVRNVGYRVVFAPEHLELAERHQRKARGALVRSSSKVKHVDFGALDQESRKAFEVVRRALSWQLEQMHYLDLRQQDLEQAVESVYGAVTRTKADVDRHDERLEELERRIAELGKDQSSKSA